MRISTTGGAGKFDDDATHAVDYCCITSDLNAQTTYVIYKCFDKGHWYWTTLSSDYCIKHDSTIGAKVESLNRKQRKPTTENELDRLMLDHFGRYGSIQVMVSKGDQVRYYDLKTQGSFFDRQIIRKATETPYMELTHQQIKPEECTIL